MKKIRLGILCKNLNSLENWEYRLFLKLYESDCCDVVALFHDGRKKNKNIFKIGNLFNKILLKIIIFIEQNIIKFKFKKNFIENKIEKIQIIKKLESIEKIFLNPKENGKYEDYFEENDCKKIENLNLDVLLRHGFKIIKGEILNIPKNGIWSFHHGDNEINRGGPPGFWEIIFNQPVTGVTLQILNDQLDGGKIIEKGFYSTKKSFLMNQIFIYEKSIEIILKNLKLLYLNGCIVSTPSKTYNREILKTPSNILTILRYLYLCTKVFKNKIKDFFLKLFGYKINAWSLCFKKGNIMSSNLSNSNFFESRKDEFWADPFAININKKNYIFFENYSYKKKKGKISCGIFKNYKIENICDVLELDHHLSYPFVFELNNSVYLMPEAAEAKRLEIYRAIDFPTKWELYSTAFEGEKIADPTLFFDKQNNIWLFLNKSKDPFNDYDSELYIYKISDLKLNKIIPHKQNPVIIDSRRARNAGNIFLNKEQLIRPSQFNINSVYGYGLNLSEITSLTIENYEEKLIKTFTPEFKKGLIGIHHVTQLNDGFFYDVCNKKI